MTIATKRGALLQGLLAGLLLASPAAGAKHDNWVEVRSPHFIVVSNAGEKQARKTAQQFEQIRTLFQSSLAVAQGHPTPVITILAMKDEKSLSEVLPEYWTKGHMHPAGWFAYRMDQFYIALNLDAQGENPYQVVYHEYYHSLTMPYFPNLPAWLAEGLADFYGNSEIKGNVATMGNASAAQIEELRQNKLIPLDVLFKVDHHSPYYNEQNKTSVFYAESWALTHYLMIGDKQSHRQMLLDYASALNQGASADAAAAKAFGDINALQKALSNYVSKYSFYFFQMKAPDELPPSDLSARAITDAEADAYRGGMFAIRGQTQVAETMLQAAVQTEPNLALGYQNLALSQYISGKRDDALASASKAIALDPKSAVTHYLRAYLNTQAGPKTEDGQVEQDLREAIALNPEFAPPFGLLGWYLAAHHRNLPEALKLAEKALQLEPANISYQLDYAEVLVQMQELDDAQRMAVRARDSASEPQQKANAERFLNYVDQVRSTSGARSTQFAAQKASATADTGMNPSGGTSPRRPKMGPPGVPMEMRGTVRDVKCNGQELEVTLMARDVQFNLHSRNYSHVDFDTRTPIQTREYDACKELKGHDVTVEFVPVENKPYDGEIHSVAIDK